MGWNLALFTDHFYSGASKNEKKKKCSVWSHEDSTLMKESVGYQAILVWSELNFNACQYSHMCNSYRIVQRDIEPDWSLINSKDPFPFLRAYCTSHKPDYTANSVLTMIVMSPQYVLWPLMLLSVHNLQNCLAVKSLLTKCIIHVFLTSFNSTLRSRNWDLCKIWVIFPWMAILWQAWNTVSCLSSFSWDLWIAWMAKRFLLRRGRWQTNGLLKVMVMSYSGTAMLFL